jgi:hypothetical protein
VKYQIGDFVWRVNPSTDEVYVTCPDCGGEGRIRCIMHDETVVSVECRACQSGYDTSSGRICYYQWTAKVEYECITGYRVEDGVLEYRTATSYANKEDELFDNMIDAHKAALNLVELHNQSEINKISNKEKDTRSWAWNASYHRKEIREANRRLEYHTAKLNVASLKAKSDKLK